MRNEKKGINTFLIFGLFLGIFFSFLFPVYQIPDEKAHLDMIYENLNYDLGSLVYDEFAHKIDTIRITGHYNEKVNLDHYFNFDIQAGHQFHFQLSNFSTIKHFPQTIGIVIGNLFHLPVFIMLLLSEVLAALFYVGVCALALKLMPFKKAMMAFIMLLPICLQQMGSFSYDVMLLAMSFLYIAYIMYLKFTKEKIELKDIVKLLLLLFLITITKIPYLLFGFLIMLLPLDKVKIRIFHWTIDQTFLQKQKKWIIMGLSIFVLLALFIMANVSYGKTLFAFLLHPFGLFKTIYITVLDHGFGFMYTIIGNFGWLDTPVSILYGIFIVICGIALCFMNYKTDKTIEKQKFKRWEIVFMILFFVMMTIVIMVSLYEWTLGMNGIVGYENWSIKQIGDYIIKTPTIIDGIQGRYFVPFLPILCLPIFSDKITKKIQRINPVWFQICYYIILVSYMALIILYRYWI